MRHSLLCISSIRLLMPNCVNKFVRQAKKSQLNTAWGQKACYPLQAPFFIHSAGDGSVGRRSFGPPLWSRLKYLNSFWISCNEIYYRHSGSTEDEAYIRFWSPGFSSSTTMFVVWSEMSRQLWDGFPWNSVHTIMSPLGWIVTMLVILKKKSNYLSFHFYLFYLFILITSFSRVQ